MTQRETDAGSRALLWALIRAMDEHGLLTDNMISSVIDQMRGTATKYEEAGDNVSAQQVSELVGQIAMEAAKRTRHGDPRDVHLKSFF